MHSTEEVADAQIEIVVGPEIQIAVGDLGQPLCSVNPEINKDATWFALDCDQAGICILQSSVVADDNVDPIPNGSLLYTCEITIAPDSVPGLYALRCLPPSASDPGGGEMSTVCVSGWVEVVESPTPSGTRPVPSTTPTPGATAIDSDGCQVTADAATTQLWLLLMPWALSYLRRRREQQRRALERSTGGSAKAST